MPDQTLPSPLRRWLRLRLRGLMIIVLVIGVGMGWLSWLIRSARTQRDAVAAIENAEGVVSYDWEWSNGIDHPGRRPWAPRWLVGLVGVDYFAHVSTAALFSSSSAADVAITQVGSFNQLEK